MLFFWKDELQENRAFQVPHVENKSRTGSLSEGRSNKRSRFEESNPSYPKKKAHTLSSTTKKSSSGEAFYKNKSGHDVPSMQPLRVAELELVRLQTSSFEALRSSFKKNLIVHIYLDLNSLIKVTILEAIITSNQSRLDPATKKKVIEGKIYRPLTLTDQMVELNLNENSYEDLADYTFSEQDVFKEEDEPLALSLHNGKSKVVNPNFVKDGISFDQE
ncbi:hypothetical protein RIF29_30103 [Crotalaria pallida]|uniref:Uncharacterized protein n=1 Tax=Crotalaria pallida TaxID=3830 RepID=A0AAN9EFQ8_CROPI